MDMEEAVEKAARFLTTSGYPTHKLISVKFDKSKNEWTLKFDVGAIMYVYITLTVDDATGRVVGYERT